jgi:hypothetical protein
LKYAIGLIATTVQCFFFSHSKAQQIDSLFKLPNAGASIISTNTVDKIEKKYLLLNSDIEKVNEQTLKKLQKQEDKLKRKVFAKDSTLGKKLFYQQSNNYLAQLNELNTSKLGLKNISAMEYVPKLDSIKTAIKYLQQSNIKLSSLNVEKVKGLQGVSSTIESLQSQLHETGDIQKLMKARKEELKQALEHIGLVKELKQMNKTLYYYQEQINSYKELLNDPDKMTEKAFSMVSELPAFKDFMRKNSDLAQLFRLPGSNSAASEVSSIQGLQTRDDILQQLQDKMGNAGGGMSSSSYLQQQAQGAQDQMTKLKSKLNSIGGGGEELGMPDFRPNDQKKKSFFKRLEYGMNLQSQRSNGLLPTTTDIAATVGYKLNDKSVLGIGVSYKVGWGNGINDISISSQGIGLRSFIDLKLKKSIWISGGYEQNYMHGFEKIPQLDDYSKWQQSGLIGLSKKYKVGKKTGNLQLLWDFLSYRQIPQTQPFKFRVGYTF